MTPARDWIRARLAETHGVACGEMWELGGRYHPSPGVTPEVVYPFAIHVTRTCREGGESVPRPLTWVLLRDALGRLEDLADGHLRLVALRAAHALGLLA